MLSDYYQILGVPASASPLDIKLAYRKMAKEHHPDKHQGAKEKQELFKLINEAYDVLSHPDKKITYDKQRLRARMHTRDLKRTTYQPYQYQPAYNYRTTKYVYSKWTLMYGKIFVVILIMVVILFPIMLEYWFSIYFYNEGMHDLRNEKYESALMNFDKAMRDLGGKNTEAAIKGAEIMRKFKSNYEVLNYTRLGLSFAVKRANKARLYFLQGQSQRHVYQSRQAALSFNQALAMRFDPDSVYEELAPLYTYQLKQYHQALSAYDSLITHFPDRPQYLLHRGFCLQKLGEHQPAIRDFSKYLKYDLMNGSALYLKAISQLAIHQKDSACHNFQLALDHGIVNAATFITLNCQTMSTH